MTDLRAKSKLKARAIQDDIFVVKVSERKYRLARLVKDGNGYSNFGMGGVGLTNIRELEFIDTRTELTGNPNLSFSDLHKELEKYAKPEVLELELER